ncbi:MAG: AMIN domain-containing protein [Candidatus Aminicenantes bacterium]|nr:AMIN domain-containing protein [Candidatus Aminicenantes bacterium]
MTRARLGLGTRAALLLGAVASIAGMISAAGFGQAGIVESITFSSSAAGLEIKVQAKGFSDAYLFTIEGPNRIILDVYGAAKTTAAPATAVNAGGVSRIRSSQYEAGVVRIVFDVASPWPTYSMRRAADGFIFLFPADLAGPPAPDITAPVVKPAEKKPEAVIVPAPIPGPEKKLESPAPAPISKAAPPEAATTKPKAVENAARPEISRAGIPIRFQATAGLVSLRDSLLAARFGNGPGVGAEVGLGLWPFAEVWILFDHFGATAPDEITGQDRTIRVSVPAAGLKFRLAQGFLSPYVAAGAGYFLYSERSGSLETKARGLGFLASAGFTLQLGRHILIDAFARYARCPLNPAGREFDAGGFRLGGGLGWRF